MLTDFFDGLIARHFNMKTEFGRQFDMVADRFLMVMVALSSIIKLSIAGDLTHSQLFQIFLLMTREIIASSIVFTSVVFGKGVPIPQVRFIAKITTTLQAITFPMILLGIYYDFFRISIYFAVLTSLVGLVSAFYYINDVRRLVYKS
jgi:phosphatidylglycerophosphate synthase